MELVIVFLVHFGVVILDKLEHLKKEITEATNGQADLEELDVLYMGEAEGEIHLFDD